MPCCARTPSVKEPTLSKQKRTCVSIASHTSLRTEGVNESDRERILVIAEPIHVLQKERNIGIVVTVFEPRNDAVSVFEFAGDRELLHLLCRAAREAMLVIVVLPSGDEREPIIGLK